MSIGCLVLLNFHVMFCFGSLSGWLLLSVILCCRQWDPLMQRIRNRHAREKAERAALDNANNIAEAAMLKAALAETQSG